MQEQHEQFVILKRATKELKHNLDTTKQDKVDLERENSKLRYDSDTGGEKLQLFQ